MKRISSIRVPIRIQSIRIQSFEFNERGDVPAFLREGITESLGRAWRLIAPLNPGGSAFAEFCERTGCTRVLDLASGTGEPASMLLDGLDRRGLRSVRFVLSDLFPKPGDMRRVAARHPGRIDICEEPVDATDVPADLGCDACTIVGAFHHFPPALGEQILADCVAKRRPIFILDVSRQTLLAFLWLFPLPGVAGMLANAVLAERDRALKAAFTFLVPLIPAASLWDLVITGLRSYSEADYLEMTRDLGDDFVWEYRDVEVLPGASFGVFFGMPAELAAG